MVFFCSRTHKERSYVIMTEHQNIQNHHILRRRLHFRAWHRGTRELDLILGRFADQYLWDLNSHELNFFSQLLDVHDPDLYDWITEKAPIPKEYQHHILTCLQSFTLKKS